MEWILGAAGTTVVILAAVGAIWRAVSWLHGRMRKIFRLVDDLAGEPPRPGFDGRPGLLERVATIEDLQRAHGKRLAAVEAELTQNHGGSLRDQVDAVARATGADTQ